MGKLTVNAAPDAWTLPEKIKEEPVQMGQTSYYFLMPVKERMPEYHDC